MMAEYRIASADIAIRCDATVDDLIDVLEAKNRAYIPVVYALNKIDAISIEELDLLYRIPNACPISAEHGWNVDELLEQMWEKLNLVRVYTRPKGRLPDYSAPVVLRSNACTVEDFVSAEFQILRRPDSRVAVQRHPQINCRAVQTSHRVRQVGEAPTSAGWSFSRACGRRHQ